MTDQTVPAPASHPHLVGEIFQHTPVKRLRELREGQPRKVAEHAGTGFNGRVALVITGVVGTMWCAYAFAVLALVVLPQAAASPLLLVQWVSQTFIQLVLLSVIMVGQNIQGKAADARAADTYKDAEAILHECVQLQEHLQAQDKILDDVLKHLHEVTPPARA